MTDFKTLRQECGLTVRQAAYLVNISQRTIRRWESATQRDCNPSALSLLRLYAQGAVSAIETSWWTEYTPNQDVHNQTFPEGTFKSAVHEVGLWRMASLVVAPDDRVMMWVQVCATHSPNPTAMKIASLINRGALSTSHA